jgi:hypothetical protein
VKTDFCEAKIQGKLDLSQRNASKFIDRDLPIVRTLRLSTRLHRHCLSSLCGFSVNNSPNLLQLNLPRLQSWLTILALCLLLGSVGLGWLVKSALIVIGLAIVTPVIGFLGFFWWVRSNIVQAECPVCNYPLQGVSGAEIQCTNCGELLQVTQGKLLRNTPPDTIDVIAVEVNSD